MTYEYAGFQYEVHKLEDGVKLVPVPGQHPAAWKDKHIRNAKEAYEQDNKK